MVIAPAWLALGVAAAASAELIQNLLWARRRSRLYREAEIAARGAGKPLLVVGRPRGRDHGCGDVCVDVAGCPECPGGVAADVRDLSMFPDGTFGAAFVGHVLESVADGFEFAVGEIHRVADRVFVAHLPDTSFSSRFHPESSCVIHTAPPETPWYVYTPIGRGRTFFLDPGSVTR